MDLIIANWGVAHSGKWAPHDAANDHRLSSYEQVGFVRSKARLLDDPEEARP